MTIKEVTKYIYKGVEYKSLNDVKEKLHDVIGIHVLDKINRECPPMNHKDFHKMLDILCSPEVRSVLLECLNVNYEVEDFNDFGDYSPRVLNILDLR